MVWGIGAVVLLAVACAERPQEQPFVEFSSDDVASVTVQVTEEGRFAPACITLGVGQTAQWINHSPLTQVNVTGLGHDELFSPNLAGRYATWSHRFERSGRFEYFDSSSGSPGRAVVDDYYGTVTYIGVGAGVTRGVACVELAPSEVKVHGSCSPETAATVCAENEICNDSGKCQTRPICRNFCCPLGVECSAGYVCNADNQQCELAPSFCVRDGDCSGKKVCGPRGECITQCITDEDCRYGTACAEQVCQPVIDISGDN